jgi:hypothetical protein
VNRSGGPRPGAEAAFAVWKDFLFGFGAPPTGTTLAEEPGRLARNTGTVYAPNTPVDVNRTVQRVRAADPVDRVSPKLSQIPRIFGRPTAKTLTLHGLGDMFVPFSMEEAYGSEVARHHLSALVVQRAIRSARHCEFSPSEAGRAWDDLAAWVHGGRRPAGDPVTDPAAIAKPDFGCRFTDTSAYPTGTRASFRRAQKRNTRDRLTARRIALFALAPNDLTMAQFSLMAALPNTRVHQCLKFVHNEACLRYPYQDP